VKEILYGTGDKEPQTELVAQLAQEAYNAHLLPQLITNLSRLDFEV
jgi:calcium binding protein 39